MAVSLGWPVMISLFQLGDPSLVVNGILFIVSILMFLYSSRAKNPVLGYWLTTILAFFGLLFIIFVTKLKVDYSLVILFPIIAFFLLGKSRGVLWTIAYIATVAGIMLFRTTTGEETFRMLFQVAFSIVTATSIIYFYQAAVDIAQSAVKERTQKLEESVTKLEEEITLRKTAETNLEENLKTVEVQKKELQDLNALMIGRENAMADLKRRVEELELKK